MRERSQAPMQRLAPFIHHALMRGTSHKGAYDTIGPSAGEPASTNPYTCLSTNGGFWNCNLIQAKHHRRRTGTSPGGGKSMLGTRAKEDQRSSDRSLSGFWERRLLDLIRIRRRRRTELLEGAARRYLRQSGRSLAPSISIFGLNQELW